MRKLLAICFTTAALLVGIQEGYAYEALDLETLKTKGSCPNCNLRGAKLKGAKLKGVNLEGANLQGANIRSARMLRGSFLQTYLVFKSWKGSGCTYPSPEVSKHRGAGG